MISKHDIQKLAELARVGLTEHEEEKLQGDLEHILAYIDKLNQAETSGAEAISNITGLKNAMRPDGEHGEMARNPEGLISAAPDSKGRFVKVKPIYGSR